MPELISQERLQPSLLDRLTDEEPGKSKETREQRVFSMRRLRESVLRDLGWLLNATNLGSRLDADAHAHVARSVLNFGVPDLAGSSVSSIDSQDLARLVHDAILNYEPRILRNSLRVELAVQDDYASHNMLSMRIEGELWAIPAPLRILVNTSLDLESGRIVIDDSAAAW